MTQNNLSNFLAPAMLRRRDSNMDRQDVQDNQKGHVLVGVGRKSLQTGWEKTEWF